MKLSDRVTESTVEELRRALLAGDFPGVTFEQAMEFLLTDGIFPVSGLPVESFSKLKSWVIERGERRSACE